MEAALEDQALHMHTWIEGQGASRVLRIMSPSSVILSTSPARTDKERFLSADDSDVAVLPDAVAADIGEGGVAAVYVCMNVYVYICMYVHFLCVCVCVYIYIYIHIYIFV